MKMRRLVSSLLAILLVMSCLSVGIVATSAANADTADTAANIDVAAAGSAYEDMLSKTTVENNYGLSSTVNDGTILQAWTWSFANIEANLETIAEQGFTTIQVSPPNEIKKGTKGAKFLQSDGQNGWWMFYQPAGFQLNNSTDNALGTKAQFVSMCEKAHELGLKVIVDAVINHMGTKEGDDNNTSSDPMSHVTPKAATYESEIYNNKLFHTPWKQMQYIESDNTYYNSAYDLTRNCTSGLPDLKTEDQRVQNAIYDYMDELIQAGADGFRFDAAKHIETPDDHDGLGSDFWTDTLKKVQTKYSDKEIYAYGEILNTCGISRPYSWYTKLFDVTDSKSYWCINNAVKSGGSVGEWNNATPNYPNANFTAANTMLWDESHDTYVDKSTTDLTTVQRGKIWALVAGRANISSVYLARPSDSTNTNDLYNITLGEARKTSWSNPTTKAINQFHNYFIGQSEYCTNNSGNTAYIERGSTGAVIVNLGGTTAKNVSLTNHKLTAGTYKDAITGNTFTVTSGKITGSVGSTGVAVIYENNEAPKPTDPPETYVLGDADGNGTVDATDATIIMRYAIDMTTLTAKQQRAADVDGDGYVTVIDASLIQRYVAHMTVKFDIGQEKEYNPNAPVNPTVPPIVIPTTPTPVDPTDPPVSKDSFLLTDNFGWGQAYVYAWDADGNALVGEWPGASQAQTQVNEYGETQFVCNIPAGAVGVILNNGSGAQTEDITDFSYDGYWMDGTQNELGHYKVTGWNYSGPVTPDDPDDPYDPPVSSGSFLLTDNFGWGSAYVYAWDADGNALNGQWPGASQAQTQTNEYGETQFVCYVPEGAVGVILNNGNGEQTEDITDFSVDGYWMDGSKNDLGHYKVTGWSSSGPVTPDDPTPTPTPVSSDSFLLTDNFGWGSAYVYAWDADGNALNGEWPGSSQAETITNDYGETQFRCYIPEGAVGVILNNGNGAQTEDITNFNYDGYWMDGSKNELGHYLVTGWNYSGDVPTDPDNPDVPYTPTPVVTDGNTIIFSNNKGFSTVNIYYWSDDQEPVTWPGVPMTSIGQNEFGEERFSFTMPEGMTNYIITDGTSQTVDIPFTGSTGVYMTDLDGEGHYLVDFYDISGGDTPVDPDPTQPDNPPVPAGSFLLTDNFGWGTAYVYAWDDNGNELYGEWPGANQAETRVNEYGETQFVCVVPEGATGVILNNGNGAQTEDITDFSYDGYWMDGTTNDLGHYKVTGWRSGDDPVDPTEPDNPVTPTQPDDPVPAGSFLLTDNFGWGTAYVYAWDDNGNELYGEWPGANQAETRVNEYGETQFVCVVPEGATGVILNNGNGAQTEDITDFSYDGYWMDGTTNDLGHYKVTGWRSGDNPVDPTEPDNPVTPTQPDDPVPAGSFLLTDNFGWGTAYVYAWDANGTELYGEWPGANQAETRVNEYGETQFVCVVPEGATGVILNNGNGAQTEDITDFSYDGYWMDGTTNDLGHYKVTGWRSGDDPVDPDPTQPDTPDPTQPDDPVPAGSFLLTDNFGWGTAYVYAWDDNGNELYGEWPGANQAETRVNEYGETQFVCVVPEGATGVILNNGNGAQTEDITDFSYDGYWMDGTTNDLGHYKVTGWRSGDDPVDPDPTQPDTPDPTQPDTPDPTQPDDPVPADSFLLTDNFGWGTAYVYAWDANGTELYGEWPGANQAETRVNEYGETQFVCVVPEGAVGVILNNGAGAQTEDITDFSYDGFWMDGTKNDLGHYKVTGWNAGDTPVTPDPTEPDTPDPTEPDDPVIGGEGGTIIFTNNKNFSTVNIYYWADGSEPVEWPGVAMTSIGLNDYGEERFTFTMPEGMTNYIINDGTKQTVDIPFTGSTGVYMLDTTDAQGHYNVDFYEIDSDNPVTPVDPTEPDDPTPSGNDVTFEPGEASVDNPAWFAWVWNDGSEGQWIQGTVSGDNIVFSGAADFGNILVVRMPTGATSGSWTQGEYWNQSEDITMQSGTLYFTGWGSGDKFTIGWK